jgi:hypothetical protein
MIEEEPSKRINFRQILEHKWYKKCLDSEYVATSEEVNFEIMKRKGIKNDVFKLRRNMERYISRNVCKRSGEFDD